MQRVLSLQMIRGIDESSEYVTKRLCISFLLSVGFICLLCGFLLGRFAAERSIEAQAQRIRVELAGNGLKNTEYLQQSALRKLKGVSFDHDESATNWRAPDLLESNMRRVNEFFSNLSFIHEIKNYASCVRAAVRGAREPDRHVVLSVNEDGITVALELARILDNIYSTDNWRPRRSLIFCVSLASSDVCPQTLPVFMRRRIVAYVALHGRFSQGHVALFGSDVMRSVAVEAVKTIPGDSNWTYLEHQVFGPRLPLDIPQVAFSFTENDLAHNITHHDRNSRGVILAQMISQTIWRLSDSIIIQWNPQYFNETVNKMLESIDTKFHSAKEKLKKTWQILLAAVEDLNKKIDATENTQMLPIRMWNDLLWDLDKALLCLDENARSRTDLMKFYQFSAKSISNTFTYLDEMVKCYEDAVQVLQER